MRARGIAHKSNRRLTAEEIARCQKASAIARRERTKEAYADLVPLVVDMRARGLSIYEICDALNAQGQRNQRGVCWQQSAMASFLRRVGLPKIAGSSAHARTRCRFDPSERDRRRGRVVASANGRRLRRRSVGGGQAPWRRALACRHRMRCQRPWAARADWFAVAIAHGASALASRRRSRAGTGPPSRFHRGRPGCGPARGPAVYWRLAARVNSGYSIDSSASFRHGFTIPKMLRRAPIMLPNDGMATD